MTIHRIHKVLSLSWHDRWSLARAWLMLLAVDVGLRVLPFRALQSMLAVDGQKDNTTVSLEPIERLSQLVGIAARNHLCEMSCLRQAMALQHLLNTHGIATQLLFGVSKDDTDSLNAHAWLEYQGQRIGELGTTPPGFTPPAPLETARERHL